MTQTRNLCDRLEDFTIDTIDEIHSINLKTALGQILAYSAFFPTHQKLHLFGNKTQLIKLPVVELACPSFEILVTGEVVS